MNLDPQVIIDDPVWIEMWAVLADVKYFSDIEPRQHVLPYWKGRPLDTMEVPDSTCSEQLLDAGGRMIHSFAVDMNWMNS